MTVSHILQAKGRDVITAAPTAKVSDVARILSERRIGAVVITGAGGRIEGIVSERDVVRRIGKDGAKALDLPVSEIMTRTVRTGARERYRSGTDGAHDRAPHPPPAGGA